MRTLISSGMCHRVVWLTVTDFRRTSKTAAVAYPGFFLGGGGSTNSVEDRGQRERGSGGGNLLVRGSGRRCNLVQEFSFHVVKLS